MKWLTAILAIIVLWLVGFGISVQASISNVHAVNISGNPTHFLFQQILYFVIAFIISIAIAAINPQFWASRHVALPMVLFVVVALLSVHVPGLGRAAKGSARWINLFGFSLQPSEFVKIAAVLLMAWWQGRSECRNERFTEGVLIPAVGIGVIVFGFLSQPDFGSAIMLCAICGPMILVGGGRLKHLLPFGLLAVAVLAILVWQNPERRSRVVSVLHVSREAVADGDEDSYQLRQSLSALESGGLKGIGFGNSVFKQDYLPENHTDFVFAMVGEEWGFCVALTCLVLFWLLLLCGTVISLRAPTAYTRLLAFGMTLHIGLSAGVNLGVVTGLLPTKGLALPFLSYGGSNLVSSLAAIGFILAVGWRCPPRPKKPRSAYDPDRKVWIS